MFDVYDADHSGFIEEADFNLVLKNLVTHNNIPLDSEYYQSLYAKYHAVWQGMQYIVDTNQDGRISLEEWYAYCEKLFEIPEGYDDAVDSIAYLVFEVFDFNHDGKLQKEEYQAMFEVYNITDTSAADNYQRIMGDKETGSKEDVRRLLTEFFTSEDPEAPGNYFFGAIDD